MVIDLGVYCICDIFIYVPFVHFKYKIKNIEKNYCFPGKSSKTRPVSGKIKNGWLYTVPIKTKIYKSLKRLRI